MDGKTIAADLIRLAATHTVARMLERDDFSKRYASNTPSPFMNFYILYYKAMIQLRCKPMLN